MLEPAAAPPAAAPDAQPIVTDSTTPVQANPLHDIKPANENNLPAATVIPSVLDTGDIVNTPDPTINWRNDLPEDWREHKMLDKHTSLDSLLKSHDSLSSMIHEKAVLRPDENSTDEDIAAWRNKIGVPETAGQYQIPPTVAEMSDADRSELFGDNGIEVLYKQFHDASLTQEQVNKIFPMMDDLMRDMGGRLQAKSEADQMTAYNKTVSDLKVAWGNNHDINLQSVNNLISKLNIGDTMQTKGLTNDYSMIMAFHEINKALGGETSIDGTVRTGVTQSFDDRIAAIEKDFNENKIDKTEYQAKRAEEYARKSQNLNQR